MSILGKIFGTEKAPEAPIQNLTPGAPVATPIVAPTTGIPEPTVNIDPNNPISPVLEPATPATPEEPKSPLDAYSKLWDTPKVEEGEKPPAKPQELKAEDIQKIMANTDFSKVVSPEMAAKIAAGGEEAQQAVMQALDVVARNVMVQSTLINKKLTDKAVAEAIKAQLADLPKMLRDASATDHLITNHPLLNDPAIKPVAEATKAKLLEHYPDATNEKIAQMTVAYLQAIGKSLTPAVVPDTEDLGEDWSKFAAED